MDISELKPWRVLGQETVFDAPPYVSVTKEQVRLPNGAVVPDFYQVRLRPFVTCVPVIENGNCLVLRQYKHGPRKTCITFPGGFVDAGESPDEACARELAEETGFKAARLVHLGEFIDNGNQRGCVGNYFLAEECKYHQLQSLDPMEDLELLEMTTKQVDRALLDGSICTSHHALVWMLAKSALSL